jgi:hypothetical protein
MSVTPEQVKSELQRCFHLHYLAEQIQGGYVLLDRDFERVKEAFAIVFTPPLRSEVTELDGLIPGFQIFCEEWRMVELPSPDEDRSGQ